MAKQSLNTWGTWVPGAQSPEVDAKAMKLGNGKKLKAFLGWNGVLLSGGSENPVDLARAYMAAAKDESCGLCFPCRMGTREMSAILDRICEGGGQEGDLARLEELAELAKDASKCDIGQTSPRPLLDLLKNCRADFEKAVADGKAIKAGEYLTKVTAPCINACPSNVDIPGYIEQIKFDDPAKSIEVARQDCPLPGVIGRVCVRPCEFNCRRALMDEPIAIKSLKRYIADDEISCGVFPEFESAPEKDKKVAIVGAGPGGLSCAFYLGKMGYKSTIFESLPEPGGMAAVGIPDYRLPRPILGRESEIAASVGSEIKYGVTVGEDITVEEMREQGYAAVFVATGAPVASSMRCEGEDAGYQCFMTGVEFLREVAFGNRPIEGQRMVVIGGGNVAMDCVRSALRTGFTDVNLIYRRTELEMPADPVEIEEAQEEGVIFHYLTQPIEVLAENHKVTGLKCIKMELGEPDASGRRRPVPMEDSEFIIEADAVVPAIGQICVVDCVLPDEEYDLTRWNTLVVDEKTFQAPAKPDVFSGGDCMTGPDTLIAALAAGKHAARYIAEYLETGECQPQNMDYLEDLYSDLGVFLKDEEMPVAGRTDRAALPTLTPEERIKSFDEVEDGFSLSQALSESRRCLRCYRIGLAAV